MKDTIEHIKGYIVNNEKFMYLDLEKIFGISLDLILRELGISNFVINDDELGNYLFIYDDNRNTLIAELIVNNIKVKVINEYDDLNRLIKKYDNDGHVAFVFYNNKNNLLDQIVCNLELEKNNVLKSSWIYEINKKYGNKDMPFPSINPL